MATSKMNFALVWGANGVSGTAMLAQLTKLSADECAGIIAVSRKPMKADFKDNRIRFVAVDVLESTIEEIAAKLKKEGGENITHVFHYTYIEKQTEDELVEVNTKLLENALKATAAVSKNVKVFSLQTGYKYYGVVSEKIVAKIPFTEDTPRHPGKNFYYNQEDLLHSFCKEHGWNWVVTRPNFIIGVAKGNYMNLGISLALYAYIQKALKKPFVFPGNQLTWEGRYDISLATNNANFQMFAATHDNCYNNAFNIKDHNESDSFREMWPKFASYFGLELQEPTFIGRSAEQKDVPQLVMDEYMKDKGPIWHEIANQYGLDEDAFKYATWKFVDFALSRKVQDVGSMEKARKFGWTRSVDSLQGFFDTWDEMKRLKMIPQDQPHGK